MQAWLFQKMHELIKSERNKLSVTQICTNETTELGDINENAWDSDSSDESPSIVDEVVIEQSELLTTGNFHSNK